MRIYFGILINAARATDRTIVTPCCGSAGGQMHNLEVWLAASSFGDVRADYFLLGSTADAPPIRSISDDAALGIPAARRCAVCGALRAASRWEPAQQRCDALDASSVLPVVHRICWNCSDLMRWRISRHFAESEANRPTTVEAEC